MTSKKTIQAVLKVLLRHLTREQIKAVLHDLCSVKGSKSFEQTIEALSTAVETEAK